GRDHPLLFNAAYGKYTESSHSKMCQDDFLWLNNHRNGTVSTISEDENVLYVRERLRHVIRAEIRSAHNLDTTILSDFGRARSLTGDTLAIIEGEQRAREEENLMSRTGTDYAKSRVDAIDIEMIERDAFLGAHVDNQCSVVRRNVQANSHFNKLATLAEKIQFSADFKDQTYRHHRQAITAAITLLKESPNIPESLMSQEFRLHYNRMYTPEGLKSILDENPQYDYDATPFTVCMQQLVDLITDVHKASPNT